MKPKQQAQQHFPELLALKTRFSDWRKNEKRTGDQVPLALRKAVLQLLHKSLGRRSVILDTLGISSQQLKAWRQKEQANKKAIRGQQAPAPRRKARRKAKQAQGFVEAIGGLLPALPCSPTPLIRFQLSLHNGMSLQIDCHDAIAGTAMLKQVMAG